MDGVDIQHIALEVWDKTTGRIQKCADKFEVALGENLEVEALDEARHQGST